MRPMSIAEMPTAAIRASHRTTGDGVHLVARRYRKGVRLDTHMHREAQLVCRQGHDAGHHAEGTLAGAARPRGVGAAAARTFHRRARGYRDADAVFRSGL